MSKRQTAIERLIEMVDLRIQALQLAREELINLQPPPAPARATGPKRAPGLPAAEKVGA